MPRTIPARRSGISSENLEQTQRDWRFGCETHLPTFRRGKKSSEVAPWAGEIVRVPLIDAVYMRATLPRLLQRVQEGERFLIMKHNRPVAELIPFRERDTARIRAAIDRLAAFQKIHSLQRLSVRKLIEEGRRF